jgi:hypothetical protein
LGCGSSQKGRSDDNRGTLSHHPESTLPGQLFHCDWILPDRRINLDLDSNARLFRTLLHSSDPLRRKYFAGKISKSILAVRNSRACFLSHYPSLSPKLHKFFYSAGITKQRIQCCFRDPSRIRNTISKSKIHDRFVTSSLIYKNSTFPSALSICIITEITRKHIVAISIQKDSKTAPNPGFSCFFCVAEAFARVEIIT